jgi:hypothetical protein
MDGASIEIMRSIEYGAVRLCGLLTTEEGAIPLNFFSDEFLLYEFLIEFLI